MLTYDSENPDNVARTNLTVTVKRNEYKPRFNQGEYSKTILEIQPIGSTVLRVSASDQNKVRATISTHPCILTFLDHYQYFTCPDGTCPSCFFPTFLFLSMFALDTFLVMCYSSLLITCPYQFNLILAIFFEAGATLVIPHLFSFLILSLCVTRPIHRNINISLTAIRFSCRFPPHHHTISFWIVLMNCMRWLVLCW